MIATRYSNKDIPMFRGPWELDVYIRYRNEQLVREHRLSAQIDPTPGETAGRLAELRRRVGIGIMRVGPSSLAVRG